MSKATGVKGYTPDRLRRSQEAQKRQAARDARDLVDHLNLMDTRPGKSRKERARLVNFSVEF